MTNEQDDKQTKKRGFPWTKYWLGNKLYSLFNRLSPQKLPWISRGGEPEITSLKAKYYQSLLAKNDGMVQHLSINIEGEWKKVEHAIYGKGEFKYQKDSYGDIVADMARQVQYFQNPIITNEEAKIFRETGTVDAQSRNIQGVTVQMIIPNGRTFFLPNLGVEEIYALGKKNFDKVNETISNLTRDLNTVLGTVGSGFDARFRGEVPKFTGILTKTLEEVRKWEEKHANELGEISSTLEKLKDAAAAEVFQHRAPASQIRFAHTYKIIKKKAVDRNGREKVFENLFPDFKRADEIAPSLDEHGYPLEVFEYPDNSKNYYVLIDKWWEEIGRNSWQETTIKGKTGGAQKWRDKVDLVRTNPTPYDTNLRIDGINYTRVRKVPDPDFVDDLDPLEKLCYMSNEWDAFRDDYRDGRWHKHSKTSMCYILERKVTPTKPINFDMDTKKLDVRINFIPIYFTTGPNKGKINPHGGMGNITTQNIPEDERQVSRVYDVEVYDTVTGNWTILRDQVRGPTHLNPAFDRAALNHEFIHWGRMFYYEGVEGINKWSENPFPHVTTRGIAKYIIGLVLRSTFSFNDARNILKGHNFDYGIRHYDPPFTTDPLGPAEGPGGALWHGKEKAKEP